MSKVAVTKDKLDYLANAISLKSGESLTLTLDEMIEAVDGIETGGAPNLQAKTYAVSAAGTETIEADSGYDGLSEVEVTVPEMDNYLGGITRGFYTSNNQRKCDIGGYIEAQEGGFVDQYYRFNIDRTFNAVASGTTVTPTTSSQTIGGADYMMEGAVTVAAMPSGTAGTPTATKGTVSNHAVTVTPSVTNTAGYISGGTKTGTAVSVSASELVSGTYTVDSSGTKDVTNYASASVPSGTAGTPSASKGTVSNHSVTVTPSVTNQTGWITGSTKTGTAVTVSASELASGNKAITQNGTGIDVVGYSTVSVNVAGAEYTKTVIAPQQTVTPNSSRVAQLSNATPLVDGKDYIVTLDGVEWLTTSETLWTSNYIIGDPNWFLSTPSTYIYPFAVGTEGSTTEVALPNTSQHTIKIERLDFVTGGTTLTTKNITSNGTYNASTDNADGYSSVTVNVGGSSPTIQSLTVAPTTSQQTFNASGVDGYKPVVVNGVSQTNLTADNIKNGTTVTISNGTSNIYSVTGTYSGGGTSKNVQVLQSTSRTNSSSLTKVLGDLTVSKTGTYDIYWSGGRTNTSTSYTWGTRLYVDGTGYGTENTTWSNNCQSNHLSNVSLTANQKLSVYARGRTGSYYTFAPMLVIVEA